MTNMATNNITIKIRAIVWPLKVSLWKAQIKAWLFSYTTADILSIKKIQFKWRGVNYVVFTGMKARFTRDL